MTDLQPHALTFLVVHILLQRFAGVGREAQRLNFLPMITNPSKVKALRSLIYSSMHQIKWMMDKSIVHGSLKKYLAIEELTQRFDALRNENLDEHYFWLVKLRNQVIDIMPPAAGRYAEHRRKLIQLLNDAENKVNANAKIRVPIH
ncbi:MAG TPA: hypothetical protein PKC38_00580 [Chitinophagales bacterium]|nr:hypothetical protein [Chitinophagales bacterium]